MMPHVHCGPAAPADSLRSPAAVTRSHLLSEMALPVRLPNIEGTGNRNGVCGAKQQYAQQYMQLLKIGIGAEAGCPMRLVL